jgi:hypothetical protein
VDVAVIDVSELVEQESPAIECVNELEGDARATPSASQDVFILGYPLGLIANAPIPVWKRGSIATDPMFDPDGLPMIYVDTATRPGMSGSAVLVRHILAGGYDTKQGARANVIYARKDLFLGVYSGRLQPDHIQAQLGKVWKRSALEETIAAGARTNTTA